MTLNDVMAVTLRYFTEFGKPVFKHITALICGGICARIVLCRIGVRVRRRRKEGSTNRLPIRSLTPQIMLIS